MFRGPIFIVGRPRSGTKLLRSLLDAHSQISIPFWESNFIPKYVHKAQVFGDLSDIKNFSLFFDFFCKIEFFRKIQENPSYSQIVNKEKWFNAIQDFSYAGAIRAFFEMYADCDNKLIWGDKSPNYMLNIRVLKDLFAKCKFIHIIRDVRDHCLSIIKTWNWNPYRAAQLWGDCIQKCRADAALYLGENYLEVKYESLLDDPKRDLSKICDFLSIKFEDSMMILKSPTEWIGDTKNSKEIVKTNKDKWHTQMPAPMIEKIEKISFNMLQELNYDVVYSHKQENLKLLEMTFARVADIWNRFLFDCSSQGGLSRAIIYQYNKRRYG